MSSDVRGRAAVPGKPDHSRSADAAEWRQSRWATVLAVLQRLLYLVVTIAVGWAVYYLLAARLSRGPEQAWVFLPVWLILAYALLPRVHKILSSLYIPDYFIGPSRTGNCVFGESCEPRRGRAAEELRKAMVTGGWVEAGAVVVQPVTPGALQTMARIRLALSGKVSP